MSKMPSASRPVYYALQLVFKVVTRLLLKMEVVGKENIPERGPFLIATNHLGLIDPSLVFVTFPHQCVIFVADKWKHYPGLSQLINLLGGIWVARGEADTEAIKASLAVLKAGYVLGLAPEGTRSPTHSLQKGKPGLAFLADRARVPVLPTALMGTENFTYYLKRFQRTPVKLVIGQPIVLPSQGRAKAEQLEAWTDLIMLRIAALLEPRYRGVYADHPDLAAQVPPAA